MLALPVIRPWRHPSLKIRIDPRTAAPGTASAIFWGFYESAECRSIRVGLPSGLSVVELGAGVGVISAVILSRLKPGNSLTCVEANPGLLATLRWNTQANSDEGVNVKIVNAAVSDRPGPMSLRVSDSHLDSAVAGSVDSEGINVDGLSLSQLVEEAGEFALVSDIEGAEAAFILGDDDGLARCVWACLELHEGVHRGRRFGIDDLVHGMARRGFRCVRVDGSVHSFSRDLTI